MKEVLSSLINVIVELEKKGKIVEAQMADSIFTKMYTPPFGPEGSDVEKPEFDMPIEDEDLPKPMPVDMPKAHFPEDHKDPFGDMPKAEEFKFESKKKHKVKVRRIK
jgi:hypothetical protein